MATYLEYLKAAMKNASYEQMADGRFFGSIPEFDGLWAVGQTREEAEGELYDALDGWLDVQIKIGKQRPPQIDGVDVFALPKPTES
ncbi:MAG: type II toxin-antitoxin system HicB family antitoxin [Candidatus Binataceae bacterium]